MNKVKCLACGSEWTTEGLSAFIELCRGLDCGDDFMGDCPFCEGYTRMIIIVSTKQRTEVNE